MGGHEVNTVMQVTTDIALYMTRFWVDIVTTVHTYLGAEYVPFALGLAVFVAVMVAVAELVVYLTEEV